MRILHWRRWLVLWLALVLVAGCGRDNPLPDAMLGLAMPADRFHGVAGFEVYGNTDGLVTEPGGPRHAVTRAMDQTGLAGSAQFRYPMIDPRGAVLRVRVDRYADARTAAEKFRGRHLPEALAMTQGLDVGDDGFIYADIYAGVRVGAVVMEVRALPGDERLGAFVDAYVSYLETFDQD